jgi:hypothetical protein
MRPFVIVFALTLLIGGTFQLGRAAGREDRTQNGPVQVVSTDESDQDIQAALDDFEKFVEEHEEDIDYVAIGRETPDDPWFARLYKVKDDNSAIGWNDEGFPTATSVVAAIEKNFLTHPDGHDETYDGK